MIKVMKRDRSNEAAIFATGLTPDEIVKVKALKKKLGFKNNSQLVNYLLDKHALSCNSGDTPPI